MRRKNGQKGSRRPERVSGSRSAGLLKLVQSGSSVYCFGAFLSAAFALFVLFSSAFGGGAPAITLPIGASEATEVSALPSRTGMPDAHFTEMVFSAWGLSPMASLLYYSPMSLTPIAHGLVALAIYKLAMSADSERPFGRSARSALTLSAITIALSGTAIQLLRGLGTDLARSELLRDTDLYAGHVMSTPFDWSPIFIGLAVGVLVVVFRAGERFQEEADGLI
jgi:hypothetical protein